jgi:hypothetical protein
MSSRVITLIEAGASLTLCARVEAVTTICVPPVISGVISAPYAAVDPVVPTMPPMAPPMAKPMRAQFFVFFKLPTRYYC